MRPLVLKVFTKIDVEIAVSKKLGVRGYAKGVSLQTTVKTNPDSLDVPDGLRCNMQPSPDLWQKVPGYSSDDEAAAT